MKRWPLVLTWLSMLTLAVCVLVNMYWLPRDRGTGFHPEHVIPGLVGAFLGGAGLIWGQVELLRRNR